jgi:ABC-type branched-subunit amino acid transport system ATPase component
VLMLMFSPDGLFELNRRVTVRLFGPMMTRIKGSRTSNGSRKATLGDPTGQIKVNQRGLVVAGVSVSFGGVKAVREVSLEVRPGEVHGLIGPNGAGKTTLIDAISGFVKTDAGDVIIGDVVVSSWSPQRRAQGGLSRSFQSLELFNDLTIAENLAVAQESSSWRNYLTDFVRPRDITLGEAASEAIRQFELEDHVNTVPSAISFGQRKTVAIARSIASAPSVLLLDEPAAGLDDHEAAELAALISHLARDWGIAILLVEHKVDMILSISDRITVLQNGGMLAEGTPDEIRSNSAVIDAYLGAASGLVLEESGSGIPTPA